MLTELGVGRTKELVIFGEALDAKTAASWGIVAEIAEDPLSSAVRWVRNANGPDKFTLRVAKMLIEEVAGALEGRNVEAFAQAVCYGRRHRLNS